MHCGTTVDAFLRENLDWLKKATNWAKFAATAGACVSLEGVGGGVYEVRVLWLPWGAWAG
jgi:26S proteasome regulatory subunit N2